jgi:hypothetical protein
MKHFIKITNIKRDIIMPNENSHLHAREHRFQINAALQGIQNQIYLNENLNDYGDERPFTASFLWNETPISITHFPSVDSNRLLIQSEINNASAPPTFEVLRMLMTINNFMLEYMQSFIGIDETGNTVLSLALSVENLYPLSLMNAIDYIKKLSFALHKASDYFDFESFRATIESHDFSPAISDKKQAEKIFKAFCQEIKSYPYIDTPYETGNGLNIGCGSLRIAINRNSKAPFNILAHCELKNSKWEEKEILINLLKINHVMSFMNGGSFCINSHNNSIAYHWHRSLTSTTAADLMDSIASMVQISGSDLASIDVSVNPEILNIH